MHTIYIQFDINVWQIMCCEMASTRIACNIATRRMHRIYHVIVELFLENHALGHTGAYAVLQRNLWMLIAEAFFPQS